MPKRFTSQVQKTLKSSPRQSLNNFHSTQSKIESKPKSRLMTTTKSSHDLKSEQCPSQGAVEIRSKSTSNVKIKGQGLNRSQRSRPKLTPKSNVKRLSSQLSVKARGGF